MDRLDQLLSFFQEDPTDPFTRFALAREYHKAGRTDQALQYYERLVAESPDYVGTFYHLGKLYEELGRPHDAIRTYTEGIRLATEHKDFHQLSELQAALRKARGEEEEW